jgi:hypothetical protein
MTTKRQKAIAARQEAIVRNIQAHRDTLPRIPRKGGSVPDVKREGWGG